MTEAGSDLRIRALTREQIAAEYGQGFVRRWNIHGPAVIMDGFPLLEPRVTPEPRLPRPIDVGHADCPGCASARQANAPTND